MKHMMRVVGYCALAGVLFNLLLNFLLVALYGMVDPVKDNPLSNQLLGALISLSVSAAIFIVVGLLALGLQKTILFVKRTIGFP